MLNNKDAQPSIHHSARSRNKFFSLKSPKLHIDLAGYPINAWLRLRSNTDNVRPKLAVYRWGVYQTKAPAATVGVYKRAPGVDLFCWNVVVQPGKRLGSTRHRLICEDIPPDHLNEPMFAAVSRPPAPRIMYKCAWDPHG